MKINSFPFWYGLLLPIGIFGLYGILKDHFASKADVYKRQVQGYNGVAAVDGECQVVVSAEAFVNASL